MGKKGWFIKTGLRNCKLLRSFLGLALKACAQTRATLSLLVNSKYLRQAMFAEQGEIGNEPLQINNGKAAATDP